MNKALEWIEIAYSSTQYAKVEKALTDEKLYHDVGGFPRSTSTIVLTVRRKDARRIADVLWRAHLPGAIYLQAQFLEDEEEKGRTYYFDIIEASQIESAVDLPRVQRIFNPRDQYVGMEIRDSVTVRTVEIRAANKASLIKTLRTQLADYRQGLNLVRDTIYSPCLMRGRHGRSRVLGQRGDDLSRLY